MESSYDVIEDLMRGRPASRMGLRENIWRQTLDKWVAEGYPTEANGKPVDPVAHFDHDWAGVGGGFDHWPLRGYREVVEEADEWHIVRNGSGAELKHWKQAAGTPEHIRFSMTSREIWEEQYRPHLLSLDPFLQCQLQRLPVHGRRIPGQHVLSLMDHVSRLEVLPRVVLPA